MLVYHGYKSSPDSVLAVKSPLQTETDAALKGEK
jgi:hypothetical protein